MYGVILKNSDFLSIGNMLTRYADSSCVRFHMPGHGGIGDDNFLKSIFKYDVTENSGTDNLYSPEKGGFVENTLNKLKSTYNTVSSVISAHGATAAIQSAVYSCIRLKGKRFFIDRRAHASVLNAMALADCTFDYFSSFDDLVRKLSECENATVLLTSPDYYGRMADVKRYSEVCKACGCLLIVDNSHGSHLLWHEKSLHPICQGADFSVDSYHKTLPVLTGGAVLHSNACEEKMLLDGIRLFASTSPSYLIAASVDMAIDFMNRDGKRLLSELCEKIAAFAEDIKNSGIEREGFELSDPYRITLRSSDENGLVYDMNCLCSFLEEKNVFPEFSDNERCVLIPSVFNTTEDFKRLADGVNSFASLHKRSNSKNNSVQYPVCKRVIALSKAVFSDKKTVSVHRASGMVSGEIKYIYPPGIPLITPGEVINDEIIKILTENNIQKIDVIPNEECQA